MHLEFRDDSPGMRIKDVFTNAEKLPPRDATITDRTASRIKFSWTGSFDGSDANNSSARVTVKYTAIFNPQRHDIFVWGYPAGYDNEYRGKGTCKLIKR